MIVFARQRKKYTILQLLINVNNILVTLFILKPLQKFAFPFILSASTPSTGGLSSSDMLITTNSQHQLQCKSLIYELLIIVRNISCGLLLFDGHSSDQLMQSDPKYSKSTFLCEQEARIRIMPGIMDSYCSRMVIVIQVVMVFIILKMAIMMMIVMMKRMVGNG